MSRVIHEGHPQDITNSYHEQTNHFLDSLSSTPPSPTCSLVSTSLHSGDRGSAIAVDKNVDVPRTPALSNSASVCVEDSDSDCQIISPAEFAKRRPHPSRATVSHQALPSIASILQTVQDRGKRARHVRAQRIAEDEWEKHKSCIERMYLRDDQPLHIVIERMKSENGFSARSVAICDHF